MTRVARHRVALVTALALLLTGGPAVADFPDWDALADVGVIEVVTRDEDGDERVAKVWFVLVDGRPYLRTNGSRWLENLRREPKLELSIEGRRYTAVAEEVTGEAIIAAVDAASAEKYGWQEALIHPFRIRKPQILVLSPRP